MNNICCNHLLQFVWEINLCYNGKIIDKIDPKPPRPYNWVADWSLIIIVFVMFGWVQLIRTDNRISKPLHGGHGGQIRGVHHTLVVGQKILFHDGKILWDSFPYNWACVQRIHLKSSRQIKFNSLWPHDAIWQQRSGSTLAQEMAWYMTVPNHYLNQCWPIISEVIWHSHVSDFTLDAQAIILYHTFENYALEILPYLPGANELNQIVNAKQI